MPIIALTREMGSLGIEVAEGLSAALGVPLVHQEIIDALADKMRVRRSHVVRYLDGKAGFLEKLTADRTSLAVFTASEILEAASREGGVVLRGWGAAQLLRRVDHAVCVRVCAPLRLRRDNMMKRLNCDRPEDLEQEIRVNDESHAAIIRRHFHLDWENPVGYDLVLNTERVPVAHCVELILSLIRLPGFQETRMSRQVLADLKLEAAVRAALRADADTREQRVDIQASCGQVALSGIVDDEPQRSAVQRVAAAVPGVQGLHSALRCERDYRLRMGG